MNSTVNKIQISTTSSAKTKKYLMHKLSLTNRNLYALKHMKDIIENVPFGKGTFYQTLMFGPVNISKWNET